MGAELGATTSIFPYDERMGAYLRATERARDWPTWPRRTPRPARGRPGSRAEPAAYFDQVIEIDLSTLEPYVVGPHTPDLARPISEMSRPSRRRRATPTTLSAALIGSCTNSSYEDIARAADRGQAGRSTTALKTRRRPSSSRPAPSRSSTTIKRDG